MSNSCIDFTVRATDSIIRLHPNLNFTAPEVGRQGGSLSFASDIFSLGMLLTTLYKCNYDKSTTQPYLINT